MNKQDTLKYVEERWQDWFVSGISDFVRIPNLSPDYDSEYFTNGLLTQAIDLVDDYVKRLEIRNIERRVFSLSNDKPPLIVYVVASDLPEAKNVMVYGHLDKQPYEEAWSEGLSPTEPTIKNGRLYGRGSSDDGYAVFSTMLAIKAAQVQGAKLPRIAMVLETEEESGSVSLLELLSAAADFIQKPDFCFCMDSGCLDYETLWMTSSLRGVAMLQVKVECGLTGYHSGEVGGLVPETFRILRCLLDRIDDSATGQVSDHFQVEMPGWKLEEAKEIAESQGQGLYTKFPLHEGVTFMNQHDLVELYLNNTWRPNLSVTGASGLPEVGKAGNVVRPYTQLKLSMRLSPTCDSKQAVQKMNDLLTENPPYGAKVTCSNMNGGEGWCMKEPEPWVKQAINDASDAFYGKPAASYGEGGSIPFLKELEGIYPET